MPFCGSMDTIEQPNPNRKKECPPEKGFGIISLHAYKPWFVGEIRVSSRFEIAALTFSSRSLRPQHTTRIAAAEVDEMASPHNSATDLVEVPSSVLSTLLDSVKELKEGMSAQQAEISQLRAEIAELRATNTSLISQIQILHHESTTPKFSKFKELPVEIRCIIWRMALTVPQIHIITDELVSRSKVNLVMQACTEARDVGLKLKLAFFQVGPMKFFNQNIRDYMNWEDDTIWIPDESFLSDRPVAFYCSECPPWPEGDSQAGHLRQIPHFCHLEVHKTRRLGGRLAINYDKWEDPSLDEDGNWEGNSTESLWYYRSIRRLYIVVNNSEAIRDRDIIFVEPAESPRRTLVRCLGCKDWEELAAKKVKTMEFFRTERAELRKKKLASGMTEEELYKAELDDLSDWIIPEVKFVEARPAAVQKDWIIANSSSGRLRV
ncbi:uncharacterized protein PAC_01603 [Phialocephala subalpina]|uniref:2EXR domain-containing protein n=1 Tax=Phialocephala subalpina TaxID=576137 RepID=A0A1L7WG20_9HELO|nr:uncharacterized protein PAC_01603 [Phialocephala subalpina]